MRKGNIIGEEVEDYVNNQINFRQSLQGAGSIFNDNSVELKYQIYHLHLCKHIYH